MRMAGHCALCKVIASPSYFDFRLSRTLRVSANTADANVCALISVTVLSIASVLCLAGL